MWLTALIGLALLTFVLSGVALWFKRRPHGKLKVKRSGEMRSGN